MPHAGARPTRTSDPSTRWIFPEPFSRRVRCGIGADRRVAAGIRLLTSFDGWRKRVFRFVGVARMSRSLSRALVGLMVAGAAVAQVPGHQHHGAAPSSATLRTFE